MIQHRNQLTSCNIQIKLYYALLPCLDTFFIIIFFIFFVFFNNGPKNTKHKFESIHPDRDQKIPFTFKLNINTKANKLNQCPKTKRHGLTFLSATREVAKADFFFFNYYKEKGEEGLNPVQLSRKPPSHQGIFDSRYLNFHSLFPSSTGSHPVK